MDISVFHLESREFEELEQALDSWDHRYRQMSPGAFRGKLQHTQVGSCGIFHNRWERAIHYEGTAPPGTIGMAISLNQTGEARWMGRQVSINDMIVQRKGTEAEYLSGSLWDSVVFALPEVDVYEHVANLSQQDPEAVISTHGVVHLAPRLAAQIREASIAYLRATRQPGNRPADQRACAKLAQDAIALIAQGLASSHVPNQARATQQRRNELVRKAKDLAADRSGQTLRIGELCRDLSVSERTLRHAFCDVTGMSPLDYLKKFRLNRVKSRLREAVAGEVLVKQIAYSNGFTHLGQFGRDYRQLFGESPSQTLLRK